MQIYVIIRQTLLIFFNFSFYSDPLKLFKDMITPLSSGVFIFSWLYQYKNNFYKGDFGMRIFIGRGGSGKTNAIFKNICAKAEKNEGKQFLLVPELYSHTYERVLAEISNNKAGRTAEVISFTRLAIRVLAEMGGLSQKSLTSAGRLLTVIQAAKNIDAGLCIYRGIYDKPSILKEILEFFDECKTCCITPEDTFEVCNLLKESSPALADKMLDLSQIYTSYEYLCENTLQDPRDILTKVCDLLEDCDLIDDIELFIDAFQSFTPQEIKILEVFIRRKIKITLALTYDKQDEDIFVSCAHTLNIITKMVRRHGQKIEILDFGDCKIQKPSDLAILEKKALLPAFERQKSDGQSVVIYYALNPFAECEYAMAFIRKTVKEKNAKWRDFAIVSRDGSSYEAALRMAASRYDVPIFYSSKVDLLARPPISLIINALKVVTNGFRTEDILTCLKTGLFNIDNESIDILENYVLCWRVRFGGWLKPFEGHPYGYGFEMDEKSKERLEQIESIRKTVISPFYEFFNEISQAKNIKDYIKSLYNFLVIIGMPEKMEIKSDYYEQNGDLQFSDEYRQLWEIIVDAMEEMVWICGDLEVDKSKFCELLPLVFSQYDVGSIPVSLDRVTCGSIERVCGAKRYKYLIVLDVNDGSIPKAPKTDSILSDYERSILELEGLNLSANANTKMLMEQEIMYRFLSCATEKLVLCCHLSGSDSKESRPSYLLSAIENKLEGVCIQRGENILENYRLYAKRSAFELACCAICGRNSDAALSAYQYFKDDEKLINAKNVKDRRRKINNDEVINLLYGKSPSLTASRIDLFNTCRFAFFMRYGLKAKPRKKAEFAAVQMGTFIHYVLENTLNELFWADNAVKKTMPTLEDAHKIMEKWVENYISTFLNGGLENQTERFKYLFKRLVKTMFNILDNILQELDISDFLPMDYELKFGSGGKFSSIICQDESNKAILSGTVDRVDGYIYNGKLYIKIVDYKSGVKSFSLSDVWNGLNLQMILYLYAIEKKGLTYYQNKIGSYINEIVPAGMLYVPTKEQLLDLDKRESDNDVIKRLREKALKRSGIVSDDLSIIDAMEKGIENESRFLPVSFKKSKKGDERQFSASSVVANLEKFGKLARFAQKKLMEMVKELKAGDISASPCKQGQSVYCDYCEYRAACKFDESMGDYIRVLEKIKDSDFWEKIGDDE